MEKGAWGDKMVKKDILTLEVCFDLLASLLDRTPSELVLSSIYCTKKKMKKGLSIAIRKKGIYSFRKTSDIYY